MAKNETHHNHEVGKTASDGPSGGNSQPKGLVEGTSECLVGGEGLKEVRQEPQEAMVGCISVLGWAGLGWAKRDTWATYMDHPCTRDRR